MFKFSLSDLSIIGLFGLLCTVAGVQPRVAEWLALALIIVAGIPHGAFDMLIARARWSSYRLRHGWLPVIYMSLGAAMTTLCLLWPSCGLALFLVISVAHFTEGERDGSHIIAAFVVAMGAIVLPISFHPVAAQRYMSFFLSEGTFQLALPLLSIARCLS